MHTKTVFALGFFDGVHLGHSRLLEACRLLAAELGCGCGVVTFHNHPDGLVHAAAPGLINTSADRERLLRRAGMERILSLSFDRALMNCPWEEFFRRLLADFGAAGLVCGEDFRFGKGGAGTAQALQSACREAGIPCRIVPQVCAGGAAVSSTRIRGLIERGSMAEAVQLLGHPHILTGPVVSGHQLGRRLGIPTANLILPRELAVPRFGVYACRVELNGQRYSAVTNVGTRPTVAGIGITVETWLLDYEGDLYGRELTLEFYAFLRPEKKFPTLEALQQEIRANARQAQEYLKTFASCAWEENVVK